MIFFVLFFVGQLVSFVLSSSFFIDSSSSSFSLALRFDGDAAGQKASWKALLAILPSLTEGIDIKFLSLPDRQDPDSFLPDGFGPVNIILRFEENLPNEGCEALNIETLNFFFGNKSHSLFQACEDGNVDIMKMESHLFIWQVSWVN